ncbi:MAG: DUF4840 domain-containing protein [Prevotella sp.]|nr:DUF4840 domain-containing protein [Prevotella sp.]
MKVLSKLMVIVLCCTASLSLFSCLGDDDSNNNMSEEDYKIYTSLLSGYYYGGKIYFYNDTITTSSNKVDSVSSLSAVIYTDSTFVIQNVPGRVLAKCITGYDALKEAIENADSKTIKAKYILYNNVSSGYLYYYVYPVSVTYDELTYNGNTHRVDISFYTPTLGVYYNGMIDIPFYLAGVYQDGDQLELFYDSTYGSDNSNTLLEFYASK